MQLPVLLRRQMDILAPTAPRPHAVVEPGEGGVLGLAPRHEAAESLQVGEVVVARPGADGGPAIGFDEVDGPGIAVAGS